MHPVDQDTLDRIAVVLGLRAPPAPAGEPSVSPTTPAAAPDAGDPTAGDVEQPDQFGGKAPSQHGDEALASSLEPVASRSATRRTATWLAEVDALADAPAGPVAPPPALEPLFVPRWARGILTAAVATRSEDGPFDVERAVDDLAAGRPLQQLPRLPWPTNRFGAQVLLDMGDGMLAFRGDQRQIVDAAVPLVGRDQVEVLRFAGCPSRGTGPKSRATWIGYEPPRRGRPVVVVSDLGLVETGSPERATAAEWEDFAATVRRAGCPLVAFVPYPAARVPPALRRAITVIPWDRSTSVRVVRQVVGS